MKWHSVAIGDISHVVTKGTTPTTSGRPFTDQGIRFIKAEALNGDTYLERNGIAFIGEETHLQLKRSILESNDVLITIAGAQIGKCGYVTPEYLPANTNQAVGIVRINCAKAVPRFVYYFFKQPGTFQSIQSLGGGQAAQPNLNLANLKRITLPLPSLNVQQIIADSLTIYDDLIENNRRRMTLLEDSARLLYNEWFVRLRFPGYEHTSIVDGVPEGWRRQSISNIADCVGGGTPSTKVLSYWENGDITWVTPTDVTRNSHLILLDSEKKISAEGLKSSSAKIVPSHTVLMTSRASVGFFAVAGREVCTNQGFISIVPNDPIHSAFLLFQLSERVEEIRAMGSGATYPEVSRGKFREFHVTIPTKRLVADFDEQATVLLKQIRILKQQNQKLRAARDLLLPRLMSGEIAV